MWTQEYDVEDVLARLGIDYRPGSTDADACCPFHDERRPSWRISLASGLWICHGCGAKGNLVQLVSRLRGTGTARAAGWLRASVTGMTRVTPTAAGPSPLTRRQMTRYLAMGQPTDAMLKARSIERAATYGCNVRADDGTWVIPVISSGGVMTGWQRKSAGEMTFLRGTRVGDALFGYEQARDYERRRDAPVILVESPLDVLRIRTAGVHGAVASFGCGVSREQIGALQRLHRFVMLALDNDGAGQAASDRLIREHPRLFIPASYGASRAKDPGEMTDAEITAMFPGNLAGSGLTQEPRGWRHPRGRD